MVKKCELDHTTTLYHYEKHIDSHIADLVGTRFKRV